MCDVPEERIQISLCQFQFYDYWTAREWIKFQRELKNSLLCSTSMSKILKILNESRDHVYNLKKKLLKIIREVIKLSFLNFIF